MESQFEDDLEAKRKESTSRPSLGPNNELEKKSEGCGDISEGSRDARSQARMKEKALLKQLAKERPSTPIFINNQNQNQSQEARKRDTDIEIFFGDVTNFGVFGNDKGSSSALGKQSEGNGQQEPQGDHDQTIEDELAEFFHKPTTAREKEGSPESDETYSQNAAAGFPYQDVPLKIQELTISKKAVAQGEMSPLNVPRTDAKLNLTLTSSSDTMEEDGSEVGEEGTLSERKGNKREDRIQNPLKNAINATAVRKLCLVGHPLTSFKGLNSFKKLHEAWVTNCKIKELKWNDFKNLAVLQRLYLFGGQIDNIEPMKFNNLKTLWLSNNNLSSLGFLSCGIPTLVELNVANNHISLVAAEDISKCVNLQSLNISANPICTVQDLEGINSLSKLFTLWLCDPSYGKCPVSSLCDSRTSLVHNLEHIKELDGLEITFGERDKLEQYVRSRCVYYYAQNVCASSSYAAMRKAALQGANCQLMRLGDRLAEISTYSAKCLFADHQMSSSTIFSKRKEQLSQEVAKIYTRLGSLRQLVKTIQKRVEMVMIVNRWEEQLEGWLKWVEYKSYGAIQAHFAHSSLDPDPASDRDGVRGTILQLISTLSCKKAWPRRTIFKLETIVVFRDLSGEAGMEKTYEDNFAMRHEPRFVPPPPMQEEELQPQPQQGNVGQQQHMQQDVGSVGAGSGGSGNPSAFYGLPVMQPPIRVVQSYMEPDWKPPKSMYSFPDSVPGLPERSQPLLLFLITKTGSGRSFNDPMEYLHNLLFEKSNYFKDIRLTNCIWTAMQLNSTIDKSKPDKYSQNSVVIVLKVLEECLVTVGRSRQCSAKRNLTDSCLIFALKRPLCYTVAYLLYSSHIGEEKSREWLEKVEDDSEIVKSISKSLEAINNRLRDLGMPEPKNAPYYLYRTHEGIKADLTSLNIVNPNLKSSREPGPVGTHMKPTNKPEILSIPKFLGADIAESITSLDLTNNRLRVVVGLKGMVNLRKLNLSCNNLSSLQGMDKLPQLREIRLGWNALRYLIPTTELLSENCNKLAILEILPNPFHDIRDIAHVPVLAHDKLPYLKRVDAWSAPFKPPPKCSLSPAPELSNIDLNFSKSILQGSPMGSNSVHLDCSGRCAQSLDFLPLFPHHKSEQQGVDLNLSDNYLSSASLAKSALVQKGEWKAFLIKLDLQQNAISDLDWMEGITFPCLKILNLSNNKLTSIGKIPLCCPKLQHLAVSGNQLPSSIQVLVPLFALKELVTLDLSRTPLSANAEYGKNVLSHMKNLEILDGIAIDDWNEEETVHSLGGTLSFTWLDTHVGQRNWANLTELSLPNCGLQKVEFPAGSLPRLLSLDLSGNALNSLAGIASLSRLRVLTVSNNRIENLGDPCPLCHEMTTDSILAKSEGLQLQQRWKGTGVGEHHSSNISSSPSSSSSSKSESVQSIVEILSASNTVTKTLQCSEGVIRDGCVTSSKTLLRTKTLFPNLEVLVLAHNGLNSLEDLHLHCLPSLKTLILNCNKLKSFAGLENIPSLQAVILDHNNISFVPCKIMSGCSSLKYLHLEHNRITAVPKLPYLKQLSALHIGFNRIQNLTDIGYLNQTSIQELTLMGNPSCKADYWKGVIAELPELQKLDGVNVFQLKLENECDSKSIHHPELPSKSEPIEYNSLPSTDDGPEPSYFHRGRLRVKPYNSYSEE